MLDKPAGPVGAAPPTGRGRFTAGPPQAAPEPLSVTGLLAILRRRRLPLLACILLVPLLAAVAISRMTPRYTATGSLIYEPSEYKVRELQSILRSDPTTEAVMASQAEILQSLKVAARVADRGNLYGNPEFNPALRPPPAFARMRSPGCADLFGLATRRRCSRPPTARRRTLARDATLLAVQAALHARPGARFPRHRSHVHRGGSRWSPRRR